MARRTISQRIALEGGEAIQKQLGALGQQGEEAFRDIQAAAEKLKGPGAEFARNMDAARKRVQELGQAFDRVGTRIRNFGAGVSVAVTAPLVLAAKRSVDAWNQQVDAISQVEAALASTAGVSKQTSEDLQAMASRFQEITTFGDEAILKMQAVLLTFTQIRGDRFEEATRAILNMSAALGKDLQGTALQVGKALNDPVKGVAALAEAGIQFTEAQKAQIKSMIDVGDVAGAQALILKELEVQFGGVAEAMAETPAGQWAQAMNALGDAFEHVGAAISPHVVQLATFIKEAALAFQGLSEGTKYFIVIVGAVAAVLGPVLLAIGQMAIGAGFLFTAFSGLAGLIATFAPALATLAGAWGFVVLAMQGVLAVVAAMLTWPVVLGAALGFLAVTVALHWDEIVATFKAAAANTGNVVQEWTAALRGWIGGAFDWIQKKISSVLDWALAKLRALKDAVSGVFGGGGGGDSSGGAPGFAGGGRVHGPGTTTSDSIFARLSTGEFVVKARAVQHYGAALFERLNRMAMPRTLVPGFAGGGLVLPALADSGGGSEGSFATLNLTIGGEVFGGLTAPRETAERLIRFATAEEGKKAGRRPAWYEGT